MGGGRKRKQPEGDSKTGKAKTNTNNNNMERWIANLAKKSLDPSTAVSSSSKAERQEKRAAKRQRRQQKVQQKQQGRQIDHDAPPTPTTTVVEEDDTTRTTSTQTQQQLRLLAMEFRDAVKRKKQKRPFQGYPLKSKRNRKKKWDMQPRPNDYGGLGLALPSLFLNLEDPAFSRRLEEEFQEHIDGFFGKQRTKAMKKQLDGQMLWRQIQRSKQQQQTTTNKNSSLLDGKKLAKMTPDQRVEAMLEAGML
ncbi:expressed unknown protein [Seminavis robusta]|uniref:Uncharacterized protein n=1 Tax=Seminavis robusta TaxID=568900 RepID=A0A9N8H4Z2_9STRA|nr:expressed unknown protein [Seminavis robusta]|eukprot:Sro128_g061100.1 n/a (250) ;mRNA; f:26683-27432